jgi:methyl-accepting chemotaxis protein
MGLAYKFSLFTILLVLLTVLIVTFYQVRREASTGGDDLVRHGRALADMVAKNCEYDLYVEDREALQQLVVSAFAEESVAYMVILNQAEEPLASKTRTAELTVPPLPDKFKPRDNTAEITQFEVENKGAGFIEIDVPIFSQTQEDSFGDSLEQDAPAAEPQRLGLIRMGLTREILEGRIREGLFSALGLSALLVLAGSVLTLLGVKKMTAPLKEMTRITEEIADGEGDLTRTFEIDSGDEIGELGNGFNRFVQRLREMVLRTRSGTSDIVGATGKIKISSQGVGDGVARQTHALEDSLKALQEIDSSAGGVAKSTSSLLGSAEESSSATLELGATIDEIVGQVDRLYTTIDEVSTSIVELTAAGQLIVSNIENLSSATEETASSVSQMDVSIREIKENAETTNTLSEKASSDAEQGMAVVEASILGINEVQEMVDRAGNAIMDLGQKSEEVGKILTVIDDVSDQTSLLALNAAIIAAQAGEHGRGFAVVAEEIRELANRSATSTSEIAEIITSIQTGTETAVNAMKAGRDRVHEEVSRSQQTRVALEQIRESSMTAANQVRGIMRATHEQSQGSQQITSSVNQVKTMLEQIFTSVSQQGTGNEHLSRSAEVMREIASLVKHSTAEQAKGSRQISTHMENVRSMIEQINGATHSQNERSQQVLKLFSELREIAEANSQRTRELDEVVETLTRQTAALEEEMGAFKV